MTQPAMVHRRHRRQGVNRGYVQLSSDSSDIGNLMVLVWVRPLTRVIRHPNGHEMVQPEYGVNE
jgi:hypothetical protein